MQISVHFLSGGGRAVTLEVGSGADGLVGDLRVRASRALNLPLHRTRLIVNEGTELDDNGARLDGALTTGNHVTVVDGLTADVVQLMARNERAILELRSALRAATDEIAALKAAPSSAAPVAAASLTSASAGAAAAAPPAARAAADLPLSIVSMASTEMDADATLAAMLDGRSSWITKLASDEKIETAVVGTAAGCVVRALRVATYGDSARIETRVEEWDRVARCPGAELLPWKKYGVYNGKGAVDPARYTPETVAVTTEVTAFRISLRHTYVGRSKNIALAVFSALGDVAAE
jgi:hypothetical protein